MSHTITIRLDPDLAKWLEETARQRGVSQGEIVRQQLAAARHGAGAQAFMAHAGAVKGPRDLSSRKGFSTK